MDNTIGNLWNRYRKGRSLGAAFTTLAGLLLIPVLAFRYPTEWAHYEALGTDGKWHDVSAGAGFLRELLGAAVIFVTGVALMFVLFWVLWPRPDDVFRWVALVPILALAGLMYVFTGPAVFGIGEWSTHLTWGSREVPFATAWRPSTFVTSAYPLPPSVTPAPWTPAREVIGWPATLSMWFAIVASISCWVGIRQGRLTRDQASDETADPAGEGTGAGHPTEKM